MSQVTDVLITIGAGSSRLGVDHLNAWINDNENPRGQQFDRRVIYRSCAGDKYMQSTVLAGAFNYLPLDEFVKVIESAPWECPEYVQLFIKEEHEERFKEIGLWERKG